MGSVHHMNMWNDLEVCFVFQRLKNKTKPKTKLNILEELHVVKLIMIVPKYFLKLGINEGR